MLKDNIIVITGASSGVGKDIAAICAKKGAIPLLLARRRDKLVELERTIVRRGLRAKSFSVDVSDTDQVRRIFHEIISQFGRIDVLINCAGFGKFDALINTNMDETEKMLSVNVTGLMACTQAALPQMIRQGRGQIVNIASMAGKLATPKSSVYSATKHAVIGFSNALRMEVEDQGIGVTVINPGPIRTPFFNIADPEGIYSTRIGRFMLEPQFVAQKTVQAIEKRKREVNLPWYMGWGVKMYQLFPKMVEKIGRHWLKMK
ncbi:SDR family oxidoreductase [Sporolactobacillus sp. THM7-7]|nr:SDR family oxidoreductase [Sporolactobacillus sp. THM7-7]